MNTTSSPLSRGVQNICPVHGEIFDHTIVSTIPQRMGRWCLICCLETLDTMGVSRITEVDK